MPTSVIIKSPNEDIQLFVSIAGRDNVIIDPEKLLDYGRDETPLIKPKLPQVVVKPEDTRTVVAVKKLAVKYGIPVIVYGHAGDGNVHLHPICINMPYTTRKRKLSSLMRDIYSAGVGI